MKIEGVFIQTYINLFVNCTDSWYRQWANSKDEHGYIHFKPAMKNNRYEYVPVTPGLIKAHIEGKVTASWPLLDANGYGKYLAFDSDLLDGQLDRLQDAWLDYGWHVLRTKGRADRDGHLFICLDQPIKGKYLIWLAEGMMKYAGVSGLERFPRSADSSSQLRGALGINLKVEANKARDWFVGPAQNIIEQLHWLSEQPLNPAAFAEQFAKEHAPIELSSVLPKRAAKAYKRADSKITFEDAIKKTNAKSGSKGWWQGHCPVPKHKKGDKNASLSIKKADDDSAIVKCWTGCLPKDVYLYLRQ